jgi:murein DD-endopeptidase MepM/ murein hydrolase activator NlpD
MPSFISPVGNALVVSGWGEPRAYRNGVHEGLDFKVPVGTAVLAVAGGKVVSSKNADPDPAGEMISVDHGNGYISRYMHLSKRLVKTGDQVYAGQLIAYSGESGIARSAPHLHFDLKGSEKAMLAYKASYGAPKGGFPLKFGTYGIPAETFIPANYAPKVKENASKMDVVMYAGGFGLVAIALVVGAYFVWRRF